jgi:hypothetical protein
VLLDPTSNRFFPQPARSLSHRKYRPLQIVEVTFRDYSIMWLRHHFFVLWDRLLAGAGDVWAYCTSNPQILCGARRNCFYFGLGLVSLEVP